MTRTVIVDDERRARERLRRMVGALETVEIVGEAANGQEALRLITERRPDLAFVDVQMPDMTGLDLVTRLPSRIRPAVVFVTAHERYAVDAFDVSAADYLLKPVTHERVKRALARAIERDSQRRLSKLVERLDGARPPQRIVGRRRGELHVLATQSVDAFVMEGELVFAITEQGRFQVDQSLKHLESALGAAHFARVHRSTLVNLSTVHVVHAIARGGASARLRSGEVIGISRRYLASFRHRLGW